jgi:hypothetical protein
MLLGFPKVLLIFTPVLSLEMMVVCWPNSFGKLAIKINIENYVGFSLNIW